VTLDIIYPVRPGNLNEELRYSLRTLEANFPNHGQVWVVGYKPNWLTNIQFIPGNTAPHARANLWHNLLAAATHPDTPNQFIIFNDDFFITEPVTDIPIGWRCPLKQHVEHRGVVRGASWWRESLKVTQICLQAMGYTNALSYELHIPFHADKQLLAETLQRFTPVTPENPPQWRTLYGVMHQIGGHRIPDGKTYRAAQDLPKPFHSTDDAVWRHYAQQYAKLYPNPSRYEK
jgi:hypothetical protein